ncbi:hypothetical protein NR800_17980 [Corallococcus interemptor]|uniref:hypothetical protein n=1 Tax=Corallococcus TaxID=83461 RepID=UPI001CBE08DF|nr:MULTISPECIES: hypothetical protein [unclassified Corallococcus]MBZ4332999.1 hypothetical protein [Corallococcus sp. AS-1-12]MBZ4373806.1 hypothetical protein [Corallococcus sp. AS-1-6]
MSPRHFMPGLLLVALVTACASSPPVEQRRPPPRILFESPLALLLEHHQELGLSTDQLIQIGQRDEALAVANRPLREELRAIWSPPMGGNPPPGTMPVRTGPAGPRGRPAYRPPAQPPEPLNDEALKRQQLLLQAMEDNETAAFREVEALLEEPQKVKARELVEKQREERARAHESMRKAPEAPPAQ